jgi:tetratricopeptide (TPR) repeat protein
MNRFLQTIAAARGLVAAAALLPMLAAALAVGPVPAANGAGTGGDRAEIEAVLRRLEETIRAKDTEAALRLFAFEDSSEATRKRDEYRSVAGLDSLDARIHLGQVTVRGASATAVALASATYREHGRDQSLTRWDTFTLRKSGGRWWITADEERDFAQTAFTDLRVRLEPDSSSMSGVATLRIGIREAGEDCLLLGLNRGLDVLRVTDAAGAELAARRTADVLTIPLASGRPLAAGDSLTLTVSFRGTLFNESRDQGYSQVSIAPEGSFASWVTSWYPHVLGTGAKSRGRLTFDVPSGTIVAASGRPAARKTVAGRDEIVFVVRHRADYSFAAAHYFHRERLVDGVAIGVYLLQGGEHKAELYESQCARILAFERGLYGMYPFDGYAVVEIPAGVAGTLGGSSEQGMNLFPVGMLPDSTLPLPLLAHEMGHSWWGNYIESGDGPIIPEGLAQLTAVLCLRAFEGEASVRRFLEYGRPDYGQCAGLYFRAFASSASRDLPLNASRHAGSAQSVLHDLADVKGHFVYNMLRERIGDGPFVRGLRRAVTGHGGGRIRLRDLRAAWERASGEDLSRFFEQWFHRPGAPELALRDTVRTRDGRPWLEGRIVQLRDPYQAEVEVVVVAGESTLVRTVGIAGPETSFAFPLPAPPKVVLLDPDYKLLRWLDEFKDGALIQQVVSLRSLGRQDAALPKLAAYLDTIPNAADAIYQSGICLEESGALAESERMLRRVADRYDLYPAYSPSVPLGFLHLGHVCDLQGRRDEALVWYRKAAEMPDVLGSRREAETLLQSPYRAPQRPTPPSPDTLQGYAGRYVSPAMGQVEIRFADGGLVATSQTTGLRSYLAWTRGSEFRFAANEAITLEFIRDAGQTTRALLRLPGREFPLTRQD